MDDFRPDVLYESRNEWTARLVSTIIPHLTHGFKSMYTESETLSIDNDEEEKILMTFQNLLIRVPHWSPSIVSGEVKRIIELSGCEYLEDLIVSVHIIHLKSLTAVRVGQKQKKIDIDMPDLDKFIHSVYIHCARLVYSNVYLFDTSRPPLEIQRFYRELEIILREGILNAIRASIPINDILRAYIDKTEEEDLSVNTVVVTPEVVEAPPAAEEEAVVEVEEVVAELPVTEVPVTELPVTVPIQTIDKIPQSDVIQPIPAPSDNVSFSETNSVLNSDNVSNIVSASDYGNPTSDGMAGIKIGNDCDIELDIISM